jgi:two-component system, OmpR family, response regulator
MITILLIDDDPKLAQLLSSYLGQHGYDVRHAPGGAQGLESLASSTPDAILLDVMMPGMDGLEVLRRLRTRSQVPVVMLTARGDETDRIVGLELGADDYLPKPFNPRELLARLKAVLRRANPVANDADRIEVSDLIIDIDGRVAHRAGRALDLTALEFDVLVALAQRAGRVVSREGLLTAAGRDDTTVSDRTVDVHISHLRRKLAEPALIKTIRGVGYLMTR